MSKKNCEWLDKWERDHDPNDYTDPCPCEGCLARKELYNDCPLGL